MDLKEIQKLIKLAKKSGLIHVKVGDLELQFTPEAIKPKVKLSSDDNIKTDKHDEMAAILWSVQDIDPLSKAQ